MIPGNGLKKAQQKMTFSGRGCARRGHGVIGTHFAEMTPKFGFLVAFGGHS